jgi:hypothetical protein
MSTLDCQKQERGLNEHLELLVHDFAFCFKSVEVSPEYADTIF